MKKEWIKPTIVDFSNSSINSATDPDGLPETVIQCMDGMVVELAQRGTGKSSTTFETCS